MSSTVFLKGIRYLLGAGNIETGTWKLLLVKSSYNSTALSDTHDFLDDVPAADRATGGGQIQTVTITPAEDPTNDQIEYAHSSNSINFTTVTSGEVVGGIVLFRSATTEAISELICYCTFTVNKTADGGTVTVTFDTEGIFKASYKSSS